MVTIVITVAMIIIVAMVMAVMAVMAVMVVMVVMVVLVVMGRRDRQLSNTASLLGKGSKKKSTFFRKKS